MSTLMPVPESEPHLALAQPAAYAPRPAIPAPPARRLDLRLMGAVMRRRWLLLATTVIAISAGAVGYAWTRPPVYAATAKLMIGLPHAPSIELGSLVAGLPVNAERIENEVQLLQSRSLAREAIVAAGLDQEPYLNPALAPAEEESWLARSASGLLDLRLPSPEELLQKLGLAGLAPAPAQPAAAPDPLQEMIDRFLDSLEVWPEGRSHVISVRVESTDPEFSARAANSLVAAYLADRLSAKLDTAHRASDWLDGRLEALRQDAERKEAAVEAYRSRAGLVAGAGAGLAAERLAELNRELAAAKAAEAQAEARFGKAQSTSADAVPEVVGSQTIRELRAREVVAAAQLAELSREFGPRHPRMTELRAQVEGVRSQIRAETRRILASLSNEYDIARARSARVQEEIDNLEAQLRDRNQGEAGLRVLAREAEAAQEVYRTFLMQANTSSQQEALQQAEGQLISAAEVPLKPSGPNRRLLALLGFMGACCTGIGLALGLEFLDRRFRSADEIRTRLGMPVAGVVPMLGSVSRTQREPQDHIVDVPETAFAEAIRALRTSLALRREGPAPRLIVLTSSVQGEGKTTLCLSIGRHTALAGRKAIVIDCDFRRPRIHHALGVRNGRGVLDFLSGVSLTDMVQVDRRTGLHYLTAGAWRKNAPELLNSPRLGELLTLLQGRYDLVLIDTPPLLPVADATVIAGMSDLALLVIGWHVARPETVEVAAARLRAATRRGQVAAILNNVDVDKVTGYGSVEVEAYRGRYGRYYAAA